MTFPLRSRALLAKCIMASICGLLLCSPLAPQSAEGRESIDHLSQAFVGAANAWRVNPIDEQSQVDPVSPQLRAAREKWMREGFEMLRNMIGDLALETSGPTFGDEINGSDVEQIPNSVWVVAKFESYHVFEYQLTPTVQRIYTEISYRTLQVIKRPDSSSLTAGSVFDECIGGGALREADGSIKQTIGSPAKYFQRPGETYLLQLTYDPVAQYYSTNRRWDVTSGTVVPDTDIQVAYAAERKSPISGLDLTQAIQYLESTLRA
jgi:hypothetical protein